MSFEARVGLKEIAVSGVMMRREGDYAVLEVEVRGVWHEVAREPIASSFSHIVEPAGIQARAENVRGVLR